MKKLKEEDKKGMYSVTLDKEVVEKSQKIMESSGRKLSPVINNLLKQWLKKIDK